MGICPAGLRKESRNQQLLGLCGIPLLPGAAEVLTAARFNTRAAPGNRDFRSLLFGAKIKVRQLRLGESHLSGGLLQTAGAPLDHL